MKTKRQRHTPKRRIIVHVQVHTRSQKARHRHKRQSYYWTVNSIYTIRLGEKLNSIVITAFIFYNKAEVWTGFSSSETGNKRSQKQNVKFMWSNPMPVQAGVREDRKREIWGSIRKWGTENKRHCQRSEKGIYMIKKINLTESEGFSFLPYNTRRWLSLIKSNLFHISHTWSIMTWVPISVCCFLLSSQESTSSFNLAFSGRTSSVCVDILKQELQVCPVTNSCHSQREWFKLTWQNLKLV